MTKHRPFPQLEMRFQTYAPFSEPDTSRAAAESVRPFAVSMEAAVLEAIRNAGPMGLCDHEIEAATGFIHQTASARRRGLFLKGLVRDSGMRRPSPSGRLAKVWVAA